MLDVNKIAQYVQLHEGLSLKPYYCTAHKLSIGIGRNLDDVGISKEEAIYLFNNDLNRAVTNLNRVFTDFMSLPENVQIVLIDMMFQLGIVGFCGFKKMIAKINARDFKGAAEEILDSKYALQTPTRAKENASKLSS